MGGLPAAPASEAEVVRLLDALHLAPSRRLGQSFLIDPFVADAEAAVAAGLRPAEVVEVGGGLGILTEALVRKGLTPLTVIERDRRLARHLRATYGGRATIVEADALDVPVPERAVVVGNLPFSVATPLFVRWMETRVRAVVALVQKEVADRLSAGPGSKVYGRLSILAALYGRIEPFQVVPARSFVPRPEVDGRIVLFERHPAALPVSDPSRLVDVVRTLFSARRKKLGNLLPRVAGGRVEARELARRAAWPDGWADLRPESLPPEAFFRLADALTPTAPPPFPRQV